MNKLIKVSLGFIALTSLVLPQFSFALVATSKDQAGKLIVDANVKPEVVVSPDNKKVEVKTDVTTSIVADVNTTIVTAEPSQFFLMGSNGFDIWRGGEKHTLRWAAKNFPEGTVHEITAWAQTTGNPQTDGTSIKIASVKGKSGEFVWTIPKSFAGGIYQLRVNNKQKITLYLFPAPSKLGNPDITGDGKVNVNDLLEVQNRWGDCPSTSSNPSTNPWFNAGCKGDISGPAGRPDGVVNQYDLDTVIDNWTGNDSVVKPTPIVDPIEPVVKPQPTVKPTPTTKPHTAETIIETNVVPRPTSKPTTDTTIDSQSQTDITTTNIENRNTVDAEVSDTSVEASGETRTRLDIAGFFGRLIRAIKFW